MNSCYLCDKKSDGKRTQVCSSTTPRSNALYTDKIAEILGEESVLIITPNDYMCQRCTALLTHVDNLEIDINNIRMTIITLFLKKYGMLSPDHQSDEMDFDVPNENITTDDPDFSKMYVPSGLRVSYSSPVKSSLNKLKQPPTRTNQLPVGQSSSSSKMKIYKCCFCSYQSKELGHVRYHLRTHSKNKEGEDSKKAQPVAKVVTPKPRTFKKVLYKCQVCSATFMSKSECFDHIQHTHTVPTRNKEENETNKVATKDSNIKKQESQNFQGSQKAANSTMETDGLQAEVTETLNYHKPAEGAATQEVQEKSQNAEESVEKLVKWLPAQVKSECGSVPVVKIEPGQENPINVSQDNFDNLDIESLLATINDNIPNAAEDKET